MPFDLNWLDVSRQQYADLKASSDRSRADREAKRIAKSSKAEGLFGQIAKAIRHLANDPKHPGLQVHEFDSLAHPYDANAKVWEAYAQNNTPGAYRIFWCYGPGQGKITIIAITRHP